MKAKWGKSWTSAINSQNKINIKISLGYSQYAPFNMLVIKQEKKENDKCYYVENFIV